MLLLFFQESECSICEKYSYTVCVDTVLYKCAYLFIMWVITFLHSFLSLVVLCNFCSFLTPLCFCAVCSFINLFKLLCRLLTFFVFYAWWVLNSLGHLSSNFQLFLIIINLFHVPPSLLKTSSFVTYCVYGILLYSSVELHHSYFKFFLCDEIIQYLRCFRACMMTKIALYF